MAKENDTKKELDYDVEDFTETGELLYGYEDEEGNIHKEFKVWEMTGADEEKIANPETRQNIGKVVTTLISRCTEYIGDLHKEEIKGGVKSGGIDPWDRIIRRLFVGDRELLLTKILEATWGRENDLSYTTQCTQCGGDVNIYYEYNEIDIIEPEGNPNEIPFELPRGVRKDGKLHKKGKMHLPRGIQQEGMDREAMNNLSKASTKMLANCVTELGDLPIVEEIFRRMGKSDRQYLMELLEANSFGLDMGMNVTCPHCGNRFESGLNPINFILG